MENLPTPEGIAIDTQFQKLVSSILTEATIELLRACNAPVEKRDEKTITSSSRISISLGSTIGFTGEFVRGSLAISIEKDFADKINPISGQSNDFVNIDWIGEFANQLLGRIKNRLLSYNIEISLSTPLTIIDGNLRLGGRNRSATHYMFAHEDHRLDVWWDAQTDPDLSISQSPENAAQAEGDMVFF